MPNLLTIPAGEPVAHRAAAHILARHAAEDLARAVIFVPSRRSRVVLREAFTTELGGKPSLLPRMVPLAEIGNELLSLLGGAAFALLEAIPPAMPLAQQRYILTQQVAIFERKHRVHVTLDYALTMADALMELQEKAARAGVRMTQSQLHALMPRDFADHWKDALQFLSILTDAWPTIEQEMGMTTATTRELQLLDALAAAWEAAPPRFPVYVVGSTASQHATARLLKTIAELPAGQVILTGLEPSMEATEWESIAAGHPLFHVNQFLDMWPLSPASVPALGNAPRSVWMEALCPAAVIPHWPSRQLPALPALKIIPCAHAEEELRVLSLLLREGVENPAHHVALITPDEQLMAQVASHMKRYGIAVDRLNAGTLAGTQTGSLWLALIAAIAEPARLLPLRSLLHHPLLGVEEGLLAGLEKGWHGVNRNEAGQLPRHEAALRAHPQFAALEQLVKQLAQLARQVLSASAWVEVCRAMLAAWVAESGQGHDAVDEQLAALSFADGFGAMPIEDFAALLADRLNSPWRDAGIHTHPRIHLLTPVEARLQQFDRVILANMCDDIWPSTPSPSPWLNRAAEEAMGLPDAAERTSLMAHDVLMLASSGEVFLTYPKRAGGSPTTPSRFIERLLTLLASHHIPTAQLAAPQYLAWAQALYASDSYAPEAPIHPRPTRAQRPRRLPVTDIEKLFSDPFHIYTKYVLNLRTVEEIDANPEASDFGSLTHRAIEVLSKHWDEAKAPASEAQLAHITQQALRAFSDRPSIDFFWRTRLMNSLCYVNRLEAERRSGLRAVQCEVVIENKIFLSSPPEGERELPLQSHRGAEERESITLHGRIDRIETRATGRSIIDHKTGTPPTAKEILDGRAPQLLAYAMLLGEGVEAVEYWALPRIGTEGEVVHAEVEPAALATLEASLCTALAHMLEESTPFLARPMGGEDKFGGDYDGISRWDEWAE